MDLFELINFYLVPGIVLGSIYALGAVGYFLLTGEPVFIGRTVVETCSHHLHTEPEPPSERLGVRVPELLEDIVMKCLSKRPDERPQTAVELRELLEAAAEDVGSWTPRQARDWWERHRANVRAAQGETQVSGSAATLAVDLSGRTD